MTKQIYVNIPVSNLAKATEFYAAIGFTKNAAFSNEKACGMVWSEEIVVMLVTHDFYRQFLRGKEIADTQTTSGVLLALSCETRDQVQKFAEAAKAHGGDYYRVDMGIPEDMMFGYEVLDPDGNQWEPIWMSPEFNPKA